MFSLLLSMMLLAAPAEFICPCNIQELQETFDQVMEKGASLPFLSAPQIGINKMILLIDSLLLIDPEILMDSGQRVTIRAYDRNAALQTYEFEGERAAIVRREVGLFND